MEGADGIKSRALQAGGHRFDPGHVHQPPENQLLKAALFCDFTNFGNLGTITISRALQKPLRRPTVVTPIPIYKDRVGLAHPRKLVSLTPYSMSRCFVPIGSLCSSPQSVW